MSWFPPYVPVAKRREQAQKKIAQLKKQGKIIYPVTIVGREIAKTVWGKAWCQHIESRSDYENRLPRGRSYVRNGSVANLQIFPGKIEALVSGSSIYTVKISISEIAPQKWEGIVKDCAGKIGTLIELLQGKLAHGVMKIMTHPHQGLFPDPKEIKVNCSCPDWAEMCKHVAAVLYGVGARLDEHPEALFMLRKVDHLDLITRANITSLTNATQKDQGSGIAEAELSAIFGIELEKSKSSQKPERKKKVSVTTTPIKKVNKISKESKKSGTKKSVNARTK